MTAAAPEPCMESEPGMFEGMGSPKRRPAGRLGTGVLRLAAWSWLSLRSDRQPSGGRPPRDRTERGECPASALRA